MNGTQASVGPPKRPHAFSSLPRAPPHPSHHFTVRRLVHRAQPTEESGLCIKWLDRRKNTRFAFYAGFPRGWRKNWRRSGAPSRGPPFRQDRHRVFPLCLRVLRAVGGDKKCPGVSPRTHPKPHVRRTVGDAFDDPRLPLKARKTEPNAAQGTPHDRAHKPSTQMAKHQAAQLARPAAGSYAATLPTHRPKPRRHNSSAHNPNCRSSRTRKGLAMRKKGNSQSGRYSAASRT